jgi:cell division protein FtsN
VGLFRSNENALQYQKQLHYNGFDSDLARQGEFYAVHVGRFDDLDEAAIWEKVLRRMGYHTLLISV